MYRGSRKHVLDWTDRPDFISELLEMVLPVPVSVNAASRWMPRGYRFPDEARLDTFGPLFLPGYHAWADLRKWWLAHDHGANTPNWDIAVACQIETQPGLVLVEAKAHKSELRSEGKALDTSASDKGKENHDRIGLAIREAGEGLRGFSRDVNIDRDTHYQLSNRCAFAWKLASLGISTVLVYLGFYADEGISEVGQPFADDADWRDTFDGHVTGIVPKELFDRRLDIGDAAAWFLIRSRKIQEPSPEGFRTS